MTSCFNITPIHRYIYSQFSNPLSILLINSRFRSSLKLTFHLPNLPPLIPLPSTIFANNPGNLHIFIMHVAHDKIALILNLIIIINNPFSIGLPLQNHALKIQTSILLNLPVATHLILPIFRYIFLAISKKLSHTLSFSLEKVALKPDATFPSYLAIAMHDSIFNLTSICKICSLNNLCFCTFLRDFYNFCYFRWSDFWHLFVGDVFNRFDALYLLEMDRHFVYV